MKMSSSRIQCVLALLVIAVSPCVAGSTVIHDGIPGLGVGAAYGAGGFVAVECEPFVAACAVATGPDPFSAHKLDWAASFTTPGGFSWSLDSIDLPLVHLTGWNVVDIILHADAAGMPGSVLETIHLVGQMSPTGTVLGVPSAVNPVLAPATLYWVEVSVDNLNDGSTVTRARWPIETTATGSVRRRQLDSGAWTTPFGGGPSAGFRVNATAVPEPGTAALLLLGLLGLGGRDRSRECGTTS
jgi:hypothetical protein